MIDRRLPRRESNRVYRAGFIFNIVTQILHDGTRCLADIRLLQQESALMKLMGMKRLPCTDIDADAAYFKLFGIAYSLLALVWVAKLSSMR